MTRWTSVSLPLAACKSCSYTRRTQARIEQDLLSPFPGWPSSTRTQVRKKFLPGRDEAHDSRWCLLTGWSSGLRI